MPAPPTFACHPKATNLTLKRSSAVQGIGPEECWATTLRQLVPNASDPSPLHLDC